MIVIFIRTVIIFIALMVVMRIMGKRQIGEMQAFELVITLIIADLACIPMADVSIPLIYGVVAIIALFIMHQLTSLLERCGEKVKSVINGKPSIVINKNGIDFDELNRNDLGVEDLIEALRNCGYFALDDVDYAVFESNGKLSTLEKQGQKGNGLPYLIISNKKINKNNLSKINKDNDWVLRVLKDKGLTLKTTGVMTIDNDGKIYLQGLKGHYFAFNVSMKNDHEVKSVC